MFGCLKTVLLRHRLALLFACLVGLIGIYPQLGFVFSLGEDYRGVFFQQAANEDGYMSIMREIQDGHLKAASVSFYEYKGAYPLLPPTIPLFYALASSIFGISLSSVLVISKFFQPAVLFLLVYFLMRRLVGEEEESGVFPHLAAISTGLLIVLGFDLVDYRSLSGFFTGNPPRGLFLIWTRTVNPISGAIFLFAFFLSLWQIVEKRRFVHVLSAGLFLALMMASYFFSWSVALAALCAILLIELYRSDRQKIVALGSIPFIAFVFSLPYWYMIFKARALPFYQDAIERIGLSHASEPHWNKFVLATTLLFAVLSFWHFYLKRRDEKLPSWWFFSLALLAAGFMAYNQQLITGVEIWYYHYVFYTIPFCFIVISLLFWHIVRRYSFKLWLAFALGVSVSSILFASYIQISMLDKNLEFYRNMQTYSGVFEYLNSAEKDCVVFASQGETETSTLITAYTHCNTYFSGERHVIANPARFYHNYMALLRLRGVDEKTIDSYLDKNLSEAKAYLYGTITYSLGFPDPKLEAALKNLPRDYKEFMRKDFAEELKKYRLDYILEERPIPQTVKNSLPLQKAYQDTNFVLYSFLP